MRLTTSIWIAGLVCCTLLPSANAQQAPPYATINSNCAITLVGDFPNLAGLQVNSSEADRLVLDSREINGVGTVALHTPFLIGGSSLLKSSAIALTGPRFDASGETATSILFAGSLENVTQHPLTVQVSNNAESSHIPFVAGPADNYASCSSITPGIVSGSPNFSGVLGGVASDETFASIVDGAVTLNGTFERLSGIEVKANEPGQLSLQTIEIEGIGPISITTPFESARTIIRDDLIVLGAVGFENYLDINQSQVRTAILYSGTDPANDLTIQYGEGFSPFPLPFGGETGSARGGFTIEDGFLTLIGDFTRLSGIEASSADGNLFMDTSASGEALTGPFDSAVAILFDELAGQQITLGVDTAADRIDGSDKIRTSIRYSGTDEEALTDLRVDIGVAGLGAIELAHIDTIVPEPSGPLPLLVAALACFYLRTPRHCCP